MSKKIILTIDDCPSIAFEEMLQFLDTVGIKAVFFCIGRRIPGNEENLVKAIQNGHVIGNHSYSHKHFSNLDLNDCYDEITKAALLISHLYRMAGHNSHPKVFRFPYGDRADLKYGHHFIPFEKAWFQHQPMIIRNWFQFFKKANTFEKKQKLGEDRKKKIQAYLAGMGYKGFPKDLVQYNFFKVLNHGFDWSWTIDVGEWRWYTSNISEEVERNILSELFSSKPYLGFGEISEPHGLFGNSSNEILLLHDHPKTMAVFKKTIRSLLDKNFTFHFPLL